MNLSKMKKSLRNADTQKLDHEIKNLLKSFHLEEKFDEAQLISSWEKIMGKSIAKRTNRIYIKDRKLFIEVSSAPLRNELSISKSKILSLFLIEFEKAIVDDIILK